MNAARPIAPAVVWSATSLIATAWATGGPVLRPGVEVDVSTFAVGLGFAAAIAWPFVTRDRVIAAFVAAQGGLVLTLVGATSGASSRATLAAVVGWSGWMAVAGAGWAWADRRGIAIASAWAAVLTAAAIVTLGLAGT